MGRDAPVLAVVILLWVVLLVVRKERVELDALLEVLYCLETPDVLGKVKVAVGVNTRADQSMPVHTLEFHVGVVLLERKVEGLSEIDVRTLNGVHVFTGHLKLVEIKVLREHLHDLIKYINYKRVLFSFKNIKAEF